MAYIKPKYPHMDTCKYTGNKRTPQNWQEFGQCPNCTGVTKTEIVRGVGTIHYDPMPLRQPRVQLYPPFGRVHVGGPVITEKDAEGVQHPTYDSDLWTNVNMREKTHYRCSHCSYEYNDAEQLTELVPQNAVPQMKVIKNPEPDYIRKISVHITTSDVAQNDVLHYEIVFVGSGGAISPQLLSFPKISGQRDYIFEHDFQGFIPIPPGCSIGVVPVNYYGRGPATSAI